MERMESESLTKRIYVSGVDRGRPKLRWRNGVERYMREGGGQANDGGRGHGGDLFVATPCGTSGVSQ